MTRRNRRTEDIDHVLESIDGALAAHDADEDYVGHDEARWGTAEPESFFDEAVAAARADHDRGHPRGLMQPLPPSRFRERGGARAIDYDGSSARLGEMIRWIRERYGGSVRYDTRDLPRRRTYSYGTLTCACGWQGYAALPEGAQPTDLPGHHCAYPSELTWRPLPPGSMPNPSDIGGGLRPIPVARGGVVWRDGVPEEPIAYVHQGARPLLGVAHVPPWVATAVLAERRREEEQARLMAEVRAAADELYGAAGPARQVVRRLRCGDRALDVLKAAWGGDTDLDELQAATAGQLWGIPVALDERLDPRDLIGEDRNGVTVLHIRVTDGF